MAVGYTDCMMCRCSASGGGRSRSGLHRGLHHAAGGNE